MVDLERIYREQGHIVLRRACRILGDEDEARESLQEIFAGLLARPAQFDGKSSVTTWLYSVTTHFCLNRLRSRRRRARLAEAFAALSSESDQPSDLLVTARQLLAALPADLAAVAVYCWIDEMTHDEIAEVLHCSRRQVGYLLERCRDQLRRRAA